MHGENVIWVWNYTMCKWQNLHFRESHFFYVWVEVQQQHWSFMLLSYIFPWLPKTLHCLWMLCHSERIFCFWFFLKRSSRSWRVSGAIPHSGIASNRNFLLFFLPWILRSVLHSGMSYPLSAAFDYSLPNTAPLCLRPSSPLFCCPCMFLMAKSSISPKRLLTLTVHSNYPGHFMSSCMVELCNIW